MSTLIRWNPWKEMEDLQRRLSSVYGLAPFRGNALTTDEQNGTLAEWAPAVDVIEDDKEYLIKVELPEVHKDNVNVTVENGTLTITGERKAEKEEKTRKYHRL